MSSPRVVPLWARIARLDQSTLTFTGKCVLQAMVAFADPDGSSCYPTIARLAAETGLHRATVSEALRHLRAIGAIKAMISALEAARARQGVEYRITIDHIPATPRRGILDQGGSSGGGGGVPLSPRTAPPCRPGRHPPVAQDDPTVPEDRSLIPRERATRTSAPPPRAPDGGLGGADPVRDEIRQALGAHRIPNKPDQVEDWHRMLMGPAWKVPPRRWAARTAINWLVGSSGSHLTWYDRCEPLLGLWQFDRNTVLRQGLAEWRETVARVSLDSQAVGDKVCATTEPRA